MIAPSTMRPTLGQCRAGVRSAAANSSCQLLARHIRPLYRPSLKWIDERKPIRSQVTALVPYRSASIASDITHAEFGQPITTPYSDLTIGVVRETYPEEKRVAITPQNATLLLKKGFKRILVEKGAGTGAQFTDQAYEKAGVTLGESNQVWAEADILLKVRAPSFDGPVSEIDLLKDSSTLISFMYPAQNRNLVEKLASRGTTSFAMDMIPRISRAQVFDALSSMANLAGYKAVLLASDHFGRMMTAQTTAAGKVSSS